MDSSVSTINELIYVGICIQLENINLFHECLLYRNANICHMLYFKTHLHWFSLWLLWHLYCRMVGDHYVWIPKWHYSDKVEIEINNPDYVLNENKGHKTQHVSWIADHNSLFITTEFNSHILKSSLLSNLNIELNWQQWESKYTVIFCHIGLGIGNLYYCV